MADRVVVQSTATKPVQTAAENPPVPASSPITPPLKGEKLADDGKEAKRDASFFKRTIYDDRMEFEVSLRGRDEDEQKKLRAEFDAKQKAEDKGAVSGQEIQRNRYTFVGGVEVPEGLTVGGEVFAYEAGPALTVGVKPVDADQDEFGAVYVPVLALVKAQERG